MAQSHAESTFVIPHPSTAKVLLLQEPHGWTLPRVEHDPPAMWTTVDQLNCLLRERLGLCATTLRALDLDSEEASHRQLLSYAVESHDPAWRPPDNGRWIGRDELDGLAIAQARQRRVLADWFTWRENATALRVPWYQTGWYAQAEEWIQQQLVQLGMTLTTPVEQLRTCQRSAILRACTDAGLVYFKAIPAAFAHELPLTCALAARFPANIPAVLAAEPERRWMLLRDVGQQTLERHPELELWVTAFRRYAQMQLALVEEVDTLRTLGCPERRLPTIAAGIDALFADTAALRPDGSWVDFTAEEYTRLQALAPASIRR